jgi:hypothetical protein
MCLFQASPGPSGGSGEITNRLFEEEDALETAAHEQAATLLRHTQMMKNPAYTNSGSFPAPHTLQSSQL